MSDLDPEAKALIQRARPGLSPTSSDRARVAEALRARLAAQPVAPSTRPRLVGGGAVVAIVAGLGWWASSLSAPPAPQRLTPVVAPAVLPPVVDPVVQPPLSPSPPESVAVAPMKPAHRPRAVPQRTQATLVAEPAAPPVEAVVPSDQGTENTLGEELRLLNVARSALRQERPLDALATLDEHASRFPNGILEEDRRALIAFALCAAGRLTDARAEAEAVLRDFPRSPHVNRLRNVCPDR